MFILSSEKVNSEWGSCKSLSTTSFDTQLFNRFKFFSCATLLIQLMVNPGLRFAVISANNRRSNHAPQ
ncbi:Uncharacterised protein [Legionella sainthelensi]|nr:Uncharacterised protein [Legionella sainthelensi]